MRAPSRSARRMDLTRIVTSEPGGEASDAFRTRLPNIWVNWPGKPQTVAAGCSLQTRLTRRNVADLSNSEITSVISAPTSTKTGCAESR